MFETLFRRVPEKWQKDEFADAQRAQVSDRYLGRITFLAKVAGAIGALFGACFLAYPLLKRPHHTRMHRSRWPGRIWIEKGEWYICRGRMRDLRASRAR